ncbi:MAG: SRPBCC family protein [Gammaproteobacteria bacterium]|nr:SRPBCC family protein [Gammaproteobacteria bacterium]
MSNFVHIPMADLEAVTGPIEQAKGLPNRVYNDPDFLAYERDQIMAKTWAGIGFAGDLPQPGYVKPVTFMGLPLVIIRDRQDKVRVFHNVCSHRGMVVVNVAGPVTGSIRCPYHSWTYDFNGDLKGTPHLGGVGVHQTSSFRCAEHGMKEVRSQVWFDVVFINLDGKAPAFDDFIAPVTARWQTYLGADGYAQMRRETTGGAMQLDVACNWKLAVENYCESYHLPWVHPGLNSYSRIQDHYHIMFAGFAGQGTRVYNLSEQAGTSLPVFPAWPAEQLKEAEYISVFPNVLLGIQADHSFAIVLDPVANNRTLEHLRIMYVGDEALNAKYEPHRAATLDSWKIVFAEDIGVVEGMQSGRASPGFEGGVFSPVLDNPTHYFNKWVADRLLAATD